MANIIEIWVTVFTLDTLRYLCAAHHRGIRHGRAYDREPGAGRSAEDIQ